MDLSVTIITRDEEEKLPGALASVRDLADEIVVLDTGSTDATCALARAESKVRLFEKAFQDFGQAKQAALDRARGAWVLALDADERVSAQLAAKIRELDANQQLLGMAGFRIRRRNIILGREMRSMGLERDYPLRLFRREGARYNRRPVHEGVLLPAGMPVGRLEEPLEHYTFGGVDTYLRKMDLYTGLEIAEGGRRFELWHLLGNPPSTFWRFFVRRGGWRDGFPGFLWASLTVLGGFLRDVKLWIRQMKREG
jgi:(heptosyl)LPS beta-1,4-glucosyltransferase